MPSLSLLRKGRAAVLSLVLAQRSPATKLFFLHRLFPVTRRRGGDRLRTPGCFPPGSARSWSLDAKPRMSNGPGDQHASHLCRPRQGHWRLASRLFLPQATGGRSDSPSSPIPGSPPRLKAFQNGSWSRSRVTLPQWRGHVSVCLMLPVMLKPTTTLREQQELAQVQGLPVLWSPSSFLSTDGNLSSETIARAIPQPARTRRGSCLPLPQRRKAHSSPS